MVIKIEKAASSSLSALGYNMGKVLEGEADVLCIDGVPEGWKPEEVFRELETKSPQIRRPSFHMSISPSATDKALTSEDAVSLTREIMKELGYEGTPVMVFRHHDIEREHFHVVSSRIGPDGLKISDSNERKRLQKIMLALGQKYGFEIGAGTSRGKAPDMMVEIPSGDGISRKTRAKDTDRAKENARPCFVQGNGGVAAQISILLDEAMKYSLSSESQFVALMQTFRVYAEKDEKTGSYILRGMSGEGKPCTQAVTAKSLMPNFDDVLSSRIRDKKDYKKDERERCRRIAVALLPRSRGYEHFQRLMASKGVDVVYYRTPENRITGAVFIDHRTMSVWKGSELDRKTLSGKAIEEHAEKNGWNDDKPKMKKVKGKVRPASLYSWRNIYGVPLQKSWKGNAAPQEENVDIPKEKEDEITVSPRPKDREPLVKPEKPRDDRRDGPVVRKAKGGPSKGNGIRRAAGVLASVAQGSGHNDEYQESSDPQAELEEQQRRLRERGL